MRIIYIKETHCLTCGSRLVKNNIPSYCLDSRTKQKASKIEPVSTIIEDGVLKVVVKKDEKEVPLIIDLGKQLGSE